jgi:hypothetical protein
MVAKHDFSQASYVIGILSIVFAVFNFPVGIVLGIIGVILGKRQKTPLAARGRKFSTIGIIIALIMLLLAIVIIGTLPTGGNFPVG